MCKYAIFFMFFNISACLHLAASEEERFNTPKRSKINHSFSPHQSVIVPEIPERYPSSVLGVPHHTIRLGNFLKRVEEQEKKERAQSDAFQQALRDYNNAGLIIKWGNQETTMYDLKEVLHRIFAFLRPIDVYRKRHEHSSASDVLLPDRLLFS